MFELDEGLEELVDAAGEIAEEELEEAFDDATEDFDADNLLAHWNRKQQSGVTRAGGAKAKPVRTGPTIKELLTKLESQLRSQFGDRAELLEYPLAQIRSTLRELFPARNQPGPSEDQHKLLQKDLHRQLNQLEDIMDSLVVSSPMGAK